MGRQRVGKRKLLLCSIAGLSLAIVSGCALPAYRTADSDECRQVRQLDAMVSRGEFDTAARKYQDLVARSPKGPAADVALFNLGLTNAHSANPKKDYKKALTSFSRIEKEFPASSLVEESRIWVGVLQAFEKANQVDLEIQQKKMGLGK